MGIKNPLVNPATADSTGERRMDFCGNDRMSQMSRAVQVWLRARLTNTIWRNSTASQRLSSTNCSIMECLTHVVSPLQWKPTHQYIQDPGTDDDREEGHGDEPHKWLDHQVIRPSCTVSMFKCEYLQSWYVEGVQSWEHEEGTGHRVDTES